MDTSTTLIRKKLIDKLYRYDLALQTIRFSSHHDLHFTYLFYRVDLLRDNLADRIKIMYPN